MVEEKATWKEMVSILNTAFLSGNTILNIDSDLLGIRLMRLDLRKGVIDDIVSNEEINNRWTDLTIGLEKGLSEELPQYFDLRDAFRNSFVSRPQNIHLLVERLNEATADNRKKKGYSRDICIGIDSNLAYCRTISHLNFHSVSLGINDLTGTSLIVPNLVKKELSIDFPKFKGSDIDMLAKALEKSPQGSRSVRRWSGCGKKKSRKAKNALSELTLLRNSSGLNILHVGSDDWVDDNEKRDMRIIEDLGDYSKSQLKNVVLLSIDKDVEARTESHHIEGFTITYPPRMERSYAADMWMMCDLLYQCGLLFGPLMIKGTGIKLFSDWNGKTIDEYREDMCLLDYDEKSNISKKCVKNLKLCRQIEYAVKGK